MKNLMIKEFRLAANPLTFFFAAATVMTLLPGYPILLGAFFVTLGIFHSFQNARESNDVIYSVLLPVKKSDFVKSKYFFALTIQLISFIIACALTAVRMTVLADAVPYLTNALMNATPFFLAGVLIIFTAFNLIFLGGFFRTAWKIGVPFIVYIAISFILVVALEAVHFFPGMQFLNATGGERLPFQFALLGAAGVIYAASFVLSMKLSISRFRRIDL